MAVRNAEIRKVPRTSRRVRQSGPKAGKASAGLGSGQYFLGETRRHDDDERLSERPSQKRRRGGAVEDSDWCEQHLNGALPE